MRVAMLVPVFCLAACDGGSGGGNAAAVDVDAAANRAQRDISNYAAAVPTPPASPRPAPSASAAAVTPAAPVPAAAPSRSVDEGGESAASAVRSYVAALAAGRYQDAWAMWRDHGHASGMSAGAFAQSFRKYASISGTVGTPYDADAGAGQRYITVPLTLSGVLRSGGAFRLEGPVILHRLAQGIPTDDARDHQWQIESTALKPRPE